MSTVQFTEATTDPPPTRESTNNSKSVYLTNPTKPYPLVARPTDFSPVPANRLPDPNLNYDTVFSNGGGKRKNNRKTKKRKRSRKSRKHKRKSTRRYR